MFAITIALVILHRISMINKKMQKKNKKRRNQRDVGKENEARKHTSISLAAKIIIGRGSYLQLKSVEVCIHTRQNFQTVY